MVRWSAPPQAPFSESELEQLMCKLLGVESCDSMRAGFARLQELGELDKLGGYLEGRDKAAVMDLGRPLTVDEILKMNKDTRGRRSAALADYLQEWWVLGRSLGCWRCRDVC
jgi:hypothetical protein